MRISHISVSTDHSKAFHSSIKLVSSSHNILCLNPSLKHFLFSPVIFVAILGMEHKNNSYRFRTLACIPNIRSGPSNHLKIYKFLLFILGISFFFLTRRVLIACFPFSVEKEQMNKLFFLLLRILRLSPTGPGKCLFRSYLQLGITCLTVLIKGYSQKFCS